MVLDSAALDIVTTMQRRHYRFYDPAFGSDPAYWRQASPLLQLSRLSIPMLVSCSTRRPDRPCDGAEAFVHRAGELGVAATVLPQPFSHRGMNEQVGEAGAYTEAIEAFMRNRSPAWANVIAGK